MVITVKSSTHVRVWSLGDRGRSKGQLETVQGKDYSAVISELNNLQCGTSDSISAYNKKPEQS